MIKINLHDYREELRRIEIQKRVVKAGSIVAATLFLVLTNWVLDRGTLSTLRAEVKDLESKVMNLEPQVKTVKSMQNRQKRIQKIITGIQNLRTNQLQLTRILSDLNNRLPEEIWLTRIKQMNRKGLEKEKVPVIFFDDPKSAKKRKKKKNPTMPEFLEISGQALRDQAVADYVSELESLPYFKLVFLFKTEQAFVGNTPVRNFTIYGYMPEDQGKKA
ncbi:MAG: hypothetical protein GWM98_10285 [Nitrospinaceae bacterium]|nr:PilN domain-containing protein [Nitrospinaceae bacterium]NIR54804.1 PilN domain-containing protein [Nitrospinaceae bacterium]NIS85229.1 PilN domain-containing protein [Nitrospinaceae bacterium]NIT82042.1 PilN domain-containing protein [Nitrospinaceae bacterium]NIU44303.1 PilN domain-containing protein [Nitrospinaceae bacterium]